MNICSKHNGDIIYEDSCSRCPACVEIEELQQRLEKEEDERMMCETELSDLKTACTCR
jgi:hypothetical protein